MEASTGQDQARWSEEAAFFDRAVGQEAVAPTDPLVLRRYASPSPRRRFREEFRFRVLKDLRGKTVLDIGCGDGRNSVLLAKFGAIVTGIDISPKSIEIARERARVDGVANQVTFICAPIEKAELPSHSFDVIWGDCVLHHLIDGLDPLMRQLALWAKPNGVMLFSEPVNFNNTLRHIRLRVPVKTDATPDERPLEPQELRIIGKSMPDMRVRFYSLLYRVVRFILVDGFNYERSSALRRAICNALTLFDYAALSVPVIKNMGSYAVIYGHPGKVVPASPL